MRGLRLGWGDGRGSAVGHLVGLDDVGGADAELGGEPRTLLDDVRGALELVRAAAQDVGVALALRVDLRRVWWWWWWRVVVVVAAVVVVVVVVVVVEEKEEEVVVMVVAAVKE